MSASNVHSPCLEAFDIQMILLYFPLKELSDVINENKRDELWNLLQKELHVLVRTKVV